MSRDITVELNVNSDVVSRKFPRVKVQPIVWNLYLKPVDNFLFKDTISVAQAISPGGVIQRSHTVEKTRSQPAETAVAESSVMLLRYDILDSEAKVFQTSYKTWLAMFLDEWRSVIHTSCHVLQANIEHSIVQCSSHQKFQREIWTYISRGLLSLLRASHTVNPFLVCEGLSLLSSVPFNDESVPESQRSARISSSSVQCYLPRIDA